MTVTPQSRIKVLDTPIAFTGICTMCGSSGGDKRKFLDFGLQLDWYGVVYLCSDCIKEFAQAVNYIDRASFDSLYKESNELQVKHDQLVKRNQAMENALRNVLGRDSDSVDDLVSSAMAVVEESTPTVESSREYDVRDSTSEQSSSSEGSDDFFDSSDFDN